MAPSALAEGGAALWDSVVDQYVLEDHEAALLVQVCRTVDVIDRLEVAAGNDVLAESSQGVKAHPAVVELRQQRIALARLMAALRLPTGTDADARTDARPQRRVGARGVYSVG